MNLTEYDYIVVNSSAGKDSQAMLDYVARLAKEQGVSDRVIVVHADLGRVEWKGTKELAEQQAKHYGFRFEVVKRSVNDLLDHVKARGKWPGPATRFCTSDHKRGPVSTLFTQLTMEFRLKTHTFGVPLEKCRILNCLGMRAEESPARSKLEQFKRDLRNCNSKREVHIWLPIHGWKVGEVWGRIKASGVPHHYAYDLGMPRLSCCFCIYAPKAALLLAGKHNPELLDQYVAVEQAIGHTFKNGFRIAEIKEDLAKGVEVGPVTDWRM